MDINHLLLKSSVGDPAQKCARNECVCAQSCPTLYNSMEYVAYEPPLSMGFSRQEYWSGLPFPSPGYLPNPGIKPTSLVSHALASRFFATVPPRKPQSMQDISICFFGTRNEITSFDFLIFYIETSKYMTGAL